MQDKTDIHVLTSVHLGSEDNIQYHITTVNIYSMGTMNTNNSVTLAAAPPEHLGRGSSLLAKVFVPGMFVLIAKVEHVEAAQHLQRG